MPCFGHIFSLKRCGMTLQNRRFWSNFDPQIDDTRVLTILGSKKSFVGTFPIISGSGFGVVVV